MRGIVSVESQPLQPQWIKPLECEIVESSKRRARIIVYVEDLDPDNLRILKNKNTIIIYSSNGEQAYYCRIVLWFKPNRLIYRINNGILTIDAYGSPWSVLRRLVNY